MKAVRSGREAQEVLESESVDLVVTDLKMPGDVNGQDFYYWICERHPALAGRVVFTASDARREEFGALIDESGCALAQKPFEVEKFLGVIRQALSQPAVYPVKR